MPRVGYNTGKYVSLTEGIKEDVLSRCLTITGARWWRERYGSKLLAFLGGLITYASVDELRSELFLALSPSRALYTVATIDIQVKETVITVLITVVPAQTRQAIQIPISLESAG